MSKTSIVEFTNTLDLGGTAKTLQIFALNLKKIGKNVKIIARDDYGERINLLKENNIEVITLGNSVNNLHSYVPKGSILHIHTSGLPDKEFKKTIQKLDSSVKIVQTNVFGGYDKEINSMISRYLFVSKTLYLKFMTQHPEFTNDPRFLVLYNPIIKPETEKNLDRELNIKKKFVLGKIGRPDLSKWSPILEDTIKILAKRNLNFICLVMSAPCSVVNRINNTPLKKYYHFLSSTSDELRINSFYESIDLLTHSSIIGETFGCTIAEAMSHGKPVIVNSTPFSKKKIYLDNAQIELVDNNKNGFVVNSPEGAADCICKLIKNKDLYNEFSEQARIKSKSFDERLITNQLNGIIGGLTNNKPSQYELEIQKQLKEYPKEYNARLLDTYDKPSKKPLRFIQNKLIRLQDNYYEKK